MSRATIGTSRTSALVTGLTGTKTSSEPPTSIAMSSSPDQTTMCSACAPSPRLRTGREASSLKWVRARTQSSPTTSLFNCHPYMKGVQCVVENHSMVLRLLRVGGALPRLETGGGRQQTTLMLIIYEVNNSTKKNGKRSSMWVLSGYRTRTLLFTLSYCS